MGGITVSLGSITLVPPGGICIVYVGIVWNSTKSYEKPWIGMSRGESTVRFTPLVDIEKTLLISEVPLHPADLGPLTQGQCITMNHHADVGRF
jgi:hypothetical protein